MASERLKRQIDGLLDEVEAAVSQLDWLVVRDRTQAVLALDPGERRRRDISGCRGAGP